MRGAHPGARVREGSGRERGIAPKAGVPRRSPAPRGEGGTWVRAPIGNAADGAGSRAIRPAGCAPHPGNRQRARILHPRGAAWTQRRPDGKKMRLP